MTPKTICRSSGEARSHRRARNTQTGGDLASPREPVVSHRTAAAPVTWCRGTPITPKDVVVTIEPTRPAAKETLLSLNGTTWVLNTKLLVDVEDLDGSIRVGLWPKGSRMAVAVPIPIQTDGDAAHFYRAVTGKQHPTLKGKLSEIYREDYKAFLEGKGQ